MKKAISIIVALVMMFALAACTPKEPTPAADAYPTKQITIICPWSAGGGTDTNARMYAEAISANKILPQSIIVENHTGGSGVVGATDVVTAEPDGYTLLMTEQGCVTVQTLLGNTTYEYTDLEPIVAITNDPIAMVVAKDADIKNTADFIAKAKAKEGGYLMGFAGAGTFGYLGSMRFVAETGIPLTEVQFDGTAEAIAAVMGHHVDTYIAAFSDVNPYVVSGEVKMIWTSKRTSFTPDGVEVLSELGIDVPTTGFCTLYAPKGTPQAVKDTLFNAFKEAQKDQKIIDYAKNAGRDVVAIGGQEVIDLVKTSYEQNETVLKALGRIK